MKRLTDENVDGDVITMQHVLDWMTAEEPWSKSTQRDYYAQIARIAGIYNVNRLSDVSADLTAFQTRFPRSAFPECFRTPAAYDAWRKKICTVLKRFHGIASAKLARQQMQDSWSDLINAMQASHAARGPALVSIRILADESRRAGRTPRDLDRDWLLQLCDDVGVGRRRGIVKAVAMLRAQRAGSSDINAMLPDELADIAMARRHSAFIFPEHLDAQIREVIESYCGGTYDEILGERHGGKSDSTIITYRSSLRKYVETAIKIGAIDGDEFNLPDYIDRTVFNAVMRCWMSEADKTRRIKEATMRAYVSNIYTIAVHIGISCDYIQAALENNRFLTQGREDAKQMPDDTQSFCRRLLRDRRAELTFLSLHIRFQQESVALMKNDNRDETAHMRRKAISLGVLAAYAAIALWSTPLRISNLRKLRIYGANPSLILPTRLGGEVMVLVEAENVKNGRPVRAKLSSGPTRALDVLEWYIHEIRPLLPYAATSNYLFPGFESEIICAQVLRNWLADCSRDYGMPMHPHNFRHGLATLYLRSHPGDYSGAAKLLFVTPNTVRNHYAWIDKEAALRDVQVEVVKMAGFGDHVQ